MQDIPASVQSTINSINRELRDSMPKSWKKSTHTGSEVVGRRKPLQGMTLKDHKRG